MRRERGREIGRGEKEEVKKKEEELRKEQKKNLTKSIPDKFKNEVGKALGNRN